MVADNPDQRIELKAFHCQIINDHESLKKEQESYAPIPIIRRVEHAVISRNYLQIKQDIQDIINTEMEKILSDAGLRHLVIRR